MYNNPLTVPLAEKHRQRPFLHIFGGLCHFFLSFYFRKYSNSMYPSMLVRKIFRINLCLLPAWSQKEWKKGGSILLTAGLPQNRSWRSIIPNWQLNGFLCFAFVSIKYISMYGKNTQKINGSLSLYQHNFLPIFLYVVMFLVDLVTFALL